MCMCALMMAVIIVWRALAFDVHLYLLVRFVWYASVSGFVWGLSWRMAGRGSGVGCHHHYLPT